jgi:hypothetical protein
VSAILFDRAQVDHLEPLPDRPERLNGSELLCVDIRYVATAGASNRTAPRIKSGDDRSTIAKSLKTAPMMKSAPAMANRRSGAAGTGSPDRRPDDRTAGCWLLLLRAPEWRDRLPMVEVDLGDVSPN